MKIPPNPYKGLLLIIFAVLFGLWASISWAAPLALTVNNLPAVDQGVFYSVQAVSASGGTSPYSYTVSGLPGGIYLNASTGLLSGYVCGKNGGYDLSFTVTDSVGGTITKAVASNNKLIVNGSASGGNCALSISPSSLSNGTVATSYSQTVTASGGTAPYTYTLTNSLPPGLSLNASTGVISGTPTTAGSFTFTVRAQDSFTSPRNITQDYIVQIQPQAITITTANISTPVIGTAYSQTIATSGAPVASFAISSGTLPAGLSLNTSTGVISGTPTTAGSYSFNVTATATAQSGGSTNSKSYSGNIAAQTISITTATLPTPVIGTAYSQTIATSGAPVASFAISSGTLPAGLSLNTSTGVISGTPTTGGAYSFTVTATATAQSGGNTDSKTYSGTIAGLPTLSITNANTTEGNSGTKTLDFTVTLSTTSINTVTVAYATADGTATAGSDYVSKSGTLSIAPGATSGTISVTLNGDTVVEADETFTVTLSSPNNATLGTATATGTITNDDTPALSITNANTAEGNSGTKTLDFTVTLSTASINTVTVAYATADGTATAGSDYVSKSGTLSIAPGATSGTISVTLNGDTVVEADETFTVTLSSPSNATLGTATATGTITNDDVIVPVIPPASFNCVEPGAIYSSPNLYTKLANASFTFDVIALQANGTLYTGYASDANKNVTLELVDGSGSTACANRTALSPAVSQTLTFNSANQGRKTSASISVGEAYPNVRCRISDSNQNPSTVACSSDSFAIRPSDFVITSSANADSSGLNVSALPVIKTNASFALYTSSDVAGYNGTPKINTGLIAAHSSAVQTGQLVGSFSASNAGSGIASGSFSYSEVGYFSLAAQAVYDDSFTTIDSMNGDCTADFSNSPVSGKFGCYFGNLSPSEYVGRFIPDHLVTQVASHGAFSHACSGFSYNGQAISYASNQRPMLTITAYNAASPAGVTKNYTGSFARLQTSQFTRTTPTTDALQKGADNSQLVKLTANLATPSLIDNGNGSLTYMLGEDSFTYQRESNALIAPFNNAIAIRIDSITDSDGVLATNLPVSLQPAGESIRYGRIALNNAYGSEMVDLPMTMQAEYYDGKNFVNNTLDTCSTATLQLTDTLATDALQVADSCIWDASGLSGSDRCPGTTPGAKSYREGASLIGGNFNLYLKTPGKPGSLTVTANVANWLKFDWKGTGNSEPTAVSSFGLYKPSDRVIFFREVY